LRYEVKTPYMTGIITRPSVRISLNPLLPGLLKTAHAQYKGMRYGSVAMTRIFFFLIPDIQTM